MSKSTLSLLLPIGLAVFASAAQASYVETCQLQGRVTSNVRQVLTEVTDAQEQTSAQVDTYFQLKVKKSTITGRADSGCHHFIGQTLPVVLHGSQPRPSHLKKGQTVIVNYMANDDNDMPRGDSFELVETAKHPFSPRKHSKQ